MHRQLVQTMRVKRFTDLLRKAGQHRKGNLRATHTSCVVSFHVNSTHATCRQKKSQ